ncbi:MAG: DUF4384 domain-containing protein [Candidatus Cloacimonetes bacterium]|nr:DUF4384 domain-containing protein [Candidatus Cloacimonadota bacterium]
MKSLVLYCAILICLGVGALYSSTTVFEPGVAVKVDTTLAFSYQLTYKEGYRITREILRKAALAKELSQGIPLADLVDRFQLIRGGHYSHALADSIFMVSSAAGFIVSEEVLKDTRQTPKGNLFRVKMEYTARVLPAAKARPSDLAVKLELSNPQPKAGENVVLTCTPPVDGYIYIFEFRADGKAAMKFPPDEGNNRIKKGSPHRFTFQPQLPDDWADGYYTLLVCFSLEDMLGWRSFLKYTEAPEHLFRISSDSYGMFDNWLPTYDPTRRYERFIQLYINKQEN